MNEQPRKNDAGSYHKMKQLRKDFEQVIQILRLMKKVFTHQLFDHIILYMHMLSYTI